MVDSVVGRGYRADADRGSMKITFPHHKKPIKGDGTEVAYLIIQHYSEGKWGFADCWEQPYAFKYYGDALKAKKVIERKQKRFEWPPNSVAIMKVSL